MRWWRCLTLGSTNTRRTVRVRDSLSSLASSLHNSLTCSLHSSL